MNEQSLLARSIRTILMAGVSSAFIAAPALAQDQSSNTDNQNAEDVERIEVTGSRIKRIGELAPTPVTVISGDSLIDAGVNNVADLLNDLPSSSVGISPETSNNTIFASGLNNTDLRGLGSERTLVLVNGRRFIGGSPGSSAVDLNNIPTAMIERIEITTGGASAVYGSDAVAGVVNIITKKSFDGIELDVSTSQPTQSGGEDEFASFTFGSEEGKATFITNLSWARQKQIKGSDRDWYVNGPVTIANPDNVDNTDGIPARVVYAYAPQSLRFYSRTVDFFGPTGHYTFSDDGQLRPFEEGEVLPAGPPGTTNTNYYIGEGDGYSFIENGYLRTPLDRVNFSTIVNYDINRDHTLTMEVNWANSQAYGESSPAFFGGLPIYADNPFLPQEAQDEINTAGGVVGGYYLAQDFGNRQYSQDRTTSRIAIGLEGSLTDTWFYNAYATVGEVQADTRWYGEMFEQRFYDAIDAVEVDGEIVCRDEIARANGCLPLNIFGRNQYSQEAYDYVATDAIREAEIGQTVFGATVTGDMFMLPAGPIAAAFSAEYREERSETLPDPAMRAGLLFNNQSQPLSGEFDVSEASAEFSIPLLADMEYVQSLTLETAYRYMDYSTSGTDDAWKIGLNYALNDDFRVRLNRSKSVRAPNISELYAPPGQTFRSLSDPCSQSNIDNANPKYQDNIIANCRAQGIPEGFEPSDEWKGVTQPGFIVGNEDLVNEVAKDITVGVVWTPSFVEDLSITVDYWSFEMENMIQYFSGPQVVQYCYQASTLDNAFCPLIERDPNNFEIVNYFEKPVNSASSETTGVDIEAAYGFDTEFGAFNFRLISTYLDKRQFNSTGFEEDLQVLTGEQSRPRWKGRFITDYKIGDFSAVLIGNYRHATVADRDWDPEVNNYNDIPSYTTWGLTARYDITSGLQVRAGIQNMFDRIPPQTPFAYDQGAYYDLRGRRITAGINYRF